MAEPVRRLFEVGQSKKRVSVEAWLELLNVLEKARYVVDRNKDEDWSLRQAVIAAEKAIAQIG